MIYEQLELYLLDFLISNLVDSIKNNDTTKLNILLVESQKQINKYIKSNFQDLKNIKDIALVNLIKKNLNNLSKTTGFNNITGFESIANYYQKETSLGIISLADGKDLLKIKGDLIVKLSNSGIRTINYESGKSFRLDKAVERELLSGQRQYLQELALARAKELDTDVFEITWHPAHRPTHDWGGKRYSLSGSHGYPKPEELFSRGSLSDYGCNHIAIPVPYYLPPIHSREELKKLEEKEKTKIEVNGNAYTPYEARVKMREINRLNDKNNLKINLFSKDEELKEKYIDKIKKYETSIKNNNKEYNKLQKTFSIYF